MSSSRAIRCCEQVGRDKKLFFPIKKTVDSYRALLARKPNWWDHKVKVLPNCTPRSFERQRYREHGKGVSELRVAVVSRLDSDKISVPLLLETIGRLSAERPGIRVCIAGYGLLGAELRRIVTMSEFGEFVDLLGWVDDVESIYRWANVVFLPSHSETMPYAVLEAAAFGCGVAAPTLGHFADTSTHALVYTFEPGNSEDAVKAILNYP